MAEIYSEAVDKGLEGVVACTTAVSSIMETTLCYRGYMIEDLAEQSHFEETAYLLWNDKLPTASELEGFKKNIATHVTLEPDFLKVLKQIPTQDVHPMAWLRTAISLAAHFDSEAQETSPDANRRKGLRMLAKMGTLVATFEAIRSNREPLAPIPEKGLAWNFLYLLKGTEPDAESVKIFDTCLVLHADHELNCSAFATRVTASALSDLYSAIVSAIGALKGPLHGGANEQVMLMLQQIGSVDKAREFVKEALANKMKIMGFGHRVYKHGDPRAAVLRKMSQRLTEKIGQPHWYEMSALIDDTVQSEKGLLPNVDFYSATVYFAMGIPIDLYTPIFAASRISGWVAHALEQYSNNRIYRPRGQWVGRQGLKYTQLDQRKG